MHQTEKQGRGCLFYGCITIIVVIIALFIGTYFGTRHAFKTIVASYTEAQPVEIPSLRLGEAERTRRLDRLNHEFEQALRLGGTSIALDETDLNLLLSRAPELDKHSDHIYLRVETNQLSAQISLPLDQFDVWKTIARRFGTTGLTGRYLNAAVSLSPAIQDGKLQLNVTDISVRGKSLPESFTGKVQLEDLADQASKNPEVRSVLNEVEGIEVKDGKVHIHIKRNASTTVI